MTEPVQDLTETKMELSKQNGGSGNPAKSMLKHSDSSFGLHSPDSFNDDVQVKFKILHSITFKSGIVFIHIFYYSSHTYPEAEYFFSFGELS